MLLFIFLVCLFLGGSDDGNLNSYLHLCKVFSLSAEPLPLSLYCLAALGYENFLPVFSWIFNCLTVLCIYLMNFSHFHAVLSPNSPLTPPLSSFLPRHPLLHSCLLFMCGPLIIRAPCLSVGGELLSRTRAIYLCLFSAAISVYVRFTLRSLTFSRMPRLLQAAHGYLVNK